MMTVDELKEAGELLKEIERHEALRTAYASASNIVISLEGVKFNPPNDQVGMTAEEIRDRVMAVFDQRIAGLRDKLQKLGVE